MKKILLLITILALSSCLSGSKNQLNKSSTILGKWIWTETFNETDESYNATPKTFKSSKKIEFTKDNRVIIYKNSIEIRHSKYTLSKGINVFNNLECNLITYEGTTYIILYLDYKNLTLKKNVLNGYHSLYKR